MCPRSAQRQVQLLVTWSLVCGQRHVQTTGLLATASAMREAAYVHQPGAQLERCAQPLLAPDCGMHVHQTRVLTRGPQLV
jgi:hypothetical protein